MKTDTYTKIILTVIAISLVVLTFGNSTIINNAVAATSMHCTGEIRANAFGGYKESIGGYEVNVKCR